MAETSVWRVAEGEEARLTPQGPTAAEIRSRRFLPLRVRTEGTYRLRPPFPGTAIVVGERTFEVVAEAAFRETTGSALVIATWGVAEALGHRL